MKYPIAIIDYGIGGLGLYKMIRKEFPKMPLLYFSDSGEIPYGKLSKAALRKRIERVVDYLKSRGVEKIVVACHSASSIVLESDKDLIGLRWQTVKAVLKHKPRSVGIIGGGRTIRSGFYRRELKKAGITTNQRVAQPLSILVERGEVKGAAVDHEISKIIGPLAKHDALLLACTHYPVLDFSKHFEGRLIDPVSELYSSIKPLLKKRASGPSLFLTTGNTKLMTKAAQNAFDVSISKVEKVTF